MVDFPIYYPTRLAPGSFIARRLARVPDRRPDDDVYYGYKMVVDVPGDTFGHGLLDEYYGVSGTDWVDAPILENPSETRTIDGRDYLLFYDGDRLRAGRLEDRQGRLLGQQHAAAVARRGPDALDRDLDARVRQRSSVLPHAMEREREKPPIGVIGVGWVGLVTARLLRRARPPGGRDGHRRGEGRVAARRRRRCRSTSPGCPSWSSATASGSRFTTEMAEVLDGAAAAVLLRRHAADLLRRRRPLAGRGGRRALPDGGEHALVMKSTVPAGTGRRDPPREARPRLRLLPRVPQGGLGGRGLPAPRPGRDRRRPRRRVGGRRGRRAPTSRSAARSSAPTSPRPR